MKKPPVSTRISVSNRISNLIDKYAEVHKKKYRTLSEGVEALVAYGVGKDIVQAKAPEFLDQFANGTTKLVALEGVYIDMLQDIARDNGWPFDLALKTVIQDHHRGFLNPGGTRRAHTKSSTKAGDKEESSTINYGALEVWAIDDPNELMALDRSRLSKEQTSDLKYNLEMHIMNVKMHQWLRGLQQEFERKRVEYWGLVKKTYPKAWERANKFLYHAGDTTKENYEDLKNILFETLRMRHVFYNHQLWEKFADELEDYDRVTEPMTYSEFITYPTPKAPDVQPWIREMMSVGGLYADDRMDGNKVNYEAVREFLCNVYEMGDYKDLYQAEKTKWRKYYGLES